MKQFLSIMCIVLTVSVALSQEKYKTKTGTVIFEASMPSFEEVKAKNENTTAIINASNGEFAALVLVKGFRFKNALMEEHFNENYAESDQYPKATFKGKIQDFDFSDITSNITEHTFNGELSFHGKTKQLTSKVLMLSKTSDGSLLLSGNFKVNVADFDIKIPKIVSKKLSRDVSIDYNFKLSQ